MEQQDRLRIEVALARADRYDAAAARAVAALLEAVNPAIRFGDNILVKPNLLRADSLACTHPAITAAACAWLLDKGCRVTIGDSAGFGTAKGIADHIGLGEALRGAGCGSVPIVSLGSPAARPLSFGGSVGLSRIALEADHILNIPKLKAHTQMRVTCAVKNLFGCICGLRKAFLHARHGDKEQGGADVFSAAVADIREHLPPMTTLLDGITAMHVTGPSGGKPFAANLLAASLSPVALDTAVYGMLGKRPQDIPLWRELQRRNASGAFPEQIVFTGEAPGAFDLSGFRLPPTLTPQTFNPARLAQSMLRRLWARVRV